MASQTEQEKKIARRKAVVVDVKEPQDVGTSGTQKLEFTVRGERGEVGLLTFRKSLFKDIQDSVGTELDMEVETRQRQWQGLPVTEYLVRQLFRDGVPVAKGQGGKYGKSLEQITQEAEHRMDELLVKNEAILRTVAFQELGQAIRAGLEVAAELQELYWRVVRENLGVPAPRQRPRQRTKAAAPAPAGTEDESGFEDLPSATKAEEQPQANGWDIFTDLVEKTRITDEQLHQYFGLTREQAKAPEAPAGHSEGKISSWCDALLSYKERVKA